MLLLWLQPWGWRVAVMALRGWGGGEEEEGRLEGARPPLSPLQQGW